MKICCKSLKYEIEEGDDIRHYSGGSYVLHNNEEFDREIKYCPFCGTKLS